MTRLPILLAFLTGIACATLLGAAAPRGRPITWEYRLLDADVEEKKMLSTIQERVAATRTKYKDDREAQEAARTASEDAWMQQISGDGWLLLGEVRPPYLPRQYLLGRPKGGGRLTIAREVTAFENGAIDEAVAKFDADWKAKRERDLPDTIGARNPWLSDDWKKGREALVTELSAAELDRCGSKGTLFVPWRRSYTQEYDRWFRAAISSD